MIDEVCKEEAELMLPISYDLQFGISIGSALGILSHRGAEPVEVFRDR